MDLKIDRIMPKELVRFDHVCGFGKNQQAITFFYGDARTVREAVFGFSLKGIHQAVRASAVRIFALAHRIERKFMRNKNLFYVNIKVR